MKQGFTPKILAGIELKNSFIKTATYEGMYDNGLPTNDLINHHVTLANGGVALTTVSYGAVSKNGKTFKDQMHLHPQSINKLKELADQVHNAGGKVSIQLTHCGYFTKNTEIKRPIAPSRIFNEYGFLSGLPFSKAMDGNDMESVKSDFVSSALELKRIGFDAVEIHMGHGYLLSQFLSPWTNKRKDEYGGNIKNRSRFPLEVFSSVKKAVGKDFPVLVKLNLSDGFKGGFNESDCIYVAQALEQLGCNALVLSGGFTSKTPFYLMRGKVPMKGMIENGTSWAEKITMRLFGPLIVKSYEFEPNFFLNQAVQVRRATSLPLAYLGGVDSMEGINTILEHGFEFIAIGRPLIHDPEFVNKLQLDEVEKSGCTRCNECVVEMDRNGIRCTIV